ncbi:lipid-A-disaccharide synthase [Solimicrobium silvestre]|uniref:Lipid-A-disaccharide synthase n=1 Tax=Solimicrobium silvestre TaxID=2099400 RepID=A0A2S9GWR3_9BURK|nr:lipid-A-disaccharide synthase [Solimicrobium silvestre]PRC92159.1 lpxB: lipid-A-disaccharide synthase [Solimicrobium silvestre]
MSANIAVVAGETSGDLLASRLLSGLRPQLPDAHMHGIGGKHMAEYGFVSDYPMETLSVRGLFEVLMHYREIKAVQTNLSTQLLAERPDVFIGVDAPDFNFTVEQRLKEAGIPTVHFIGPSIWAWRAGRIKKIIKSVSHMLVIFPFESEIYQAANIPVTYVGHPLAEVLPLEPDMMAARKELGLPLDANVVTIMPGSRLSEINYNTAAFIGAAKLLAERDPSIRFVVPMAGSKQRDAYIQQVVQAKLMDVPVLLIDGRSHTAITAANSVLVASGTATLEVALLKKPMVIAYKQIWASWQIMRHMGYQPWVGLPNILAREFLVPEFLQDAATPLALADALWKQLHDDKLVTRLKQRFLEMHHSLLRDSARESAQAILQVINK